MRVRVFLFSLCSLMLFISCSSSKPKLGLIADGRLQACPGSPNCLVSYDQYTNPKSYYPPYVTNNLQATRQQIAFYLTTLDNVSVEESERDYIHATFRSNWFKFVDDFEAYFDEQTMAVYFRSASRSGYYDFGVNKKRLDRLVDFLRRQR